MKKIKGKNMSLIVKGNALIGASYNLEVVEQRLILLATVEARRSGKGINALDPLTIHASSYMEQFGVSRQTAYQALKDACKDLFARQFSYQEHSAKGNVTQKTSRWVSEIGYTEEEATVQLIFAPVVVPFITRLEEQFTSYELTQVASLASKYSIRLYELLMQWKNVGKMKISLEDLRAKLGLEQDDYTVMGDFKRSVLDLSVKQINEHTDIKVDYEQHKKGRSIAGFTFRLKQKPTQKKIENRDPDTLDLFVKMTDAQRSMFGLKLAHDNRIGSEYSHLIGQESYEDFGKILADMLLDEKFFKKVYPILLENGYQRPRAKA